MKKIISFCLWGDKPKYCIGAIRNAELAKEIYPDWECRFYCNKNVPIEIINKLKSQPNTEVFIINGEPNWKFATKRFLAISDQSCDYIIVRDADSRLSLREKYAVEEWISSGKSLHIMRDHPAHGNFPIFAGMFGVKGKKVENIDEVLQFFEKTEVEHYNYDQRFLQKYLFPVFTNDIHLNDEIFNNCPFPTERYDYEFVGQIFDANDNRALRHVESLKNFLKK